jgi:hypothetical protein
LIKGQLLLNILSWVVEEQLDKLAAAVEAAAVLEDY